MKAIVCPKCKKGINRRIKVKGDKNYFDVKCLWCGHMFKKAKWTATPEEKKRIEGK